MKKRGAAQRWLARKRKERSEVEIEIEEMEISLLNIAIREPGAMQRIGLPGSPYPCAEPEAAREVIQLKRWMEEKVFRKETVKDAEGKPVKNPDGTEAFNYFWSSWKGKLKQRYITRLIHVLDHYKQAFSTMPWVESWTTLKAKLLNEKIDWIGVEEEEEPKAPEPGNDGKAA